MFCEFNLVNIHKLANSSRTTKAREKNRHRFGTLRILEKKIMYIWLNLITIKFYFMKLTTNFQGQPSYLLGQISSLDLMGEGGLAPSSQTVGSFLRTPGQGIIHSAKSQFVDPCVCRPQKAASSHFLCDLDYFARPLHSIQIFIISDDVLILY